MNTTTTSGLKGGSGLLVLLAAVLLSAAPVGAQTVASITSTQIVGEASWATRMFGKLSWEQVAAECSSPREICHLVEKNVRYKKEKQDQWATPEQTWTSGKGDCEDFALCIQDICSLKGISTKVHLYFPATGGKEGHAVLVGEWNGKVWFSSNGEYEEVKSEDEVKQRVARMLSCKEKQLWGLKLSERDVAKYLEKGLAVAGTTAAR